MSPRALAAVSSGLAVTAAWFAVRTKWYSTALWLTLLLAVLALAPRERTLVHPAWAAVAIRNRSPITVPRRLGFGPDTA